MIILRLISSVIIAKLRTIKHRGPLALFLIPNAEHTTRLMKSTPHSSLRLTKCAVDAAEGSFSTITLFIQRMILKVFGANGGHLPSPSVSESSSMHSICQLS